MDLFENYFRRLIRFRTIYCVVLLCGVFLFVGLNTAYANENDDFFDRIKVAFTYRIIQFVEWVDDGGGNKSPANICVYANDNINRLFLDYEWKEINGQDIQVLFLNKLPDASDRCYVLYISHSELAHSPQILKQIASLGKILTVSDIDQFAKLGGMVELKIHEKSVKMEINVSNAMNVGIRFSSKLLEVANIVGRD